MKRLGLVVGLLLGAAFSTASRAADEPRFIVDTYDIIGGCPDEAAFRAEVENRVHARTKAPMHVVVHVVQQPRNIDGTVDVIDASGARSSRKVSSTRCSEIVSAAALVVALAIDDAAENAPAKPEPKPPVGEVTPNVAPLTIDTGSRGAERRVKDSDLVFRAGAEVGLQSAVSPTPVASVPIFVELGSEARSIGFHFEPRARLAWTFAASSRGEAVNVGAANFSWMSGALDLCPARFAFATTLDLRGCGRLEVGRLVGEGLGTPSKTGRQLWLGAGIPLTFRFMPRDFGGVFFELEAGPRFPLIKDDFRIGTLNSLVFRPPSVGFSGGIGGGISFR